MRSLYLIVFAIVSMLQSACTLGQTSSSDIVASSAIAKIEGVDLEAPANPSKHNVMQELIDLGASHVALMPYAYTDGKTTIVQYGSDWQWWGERSEGIEKMTIEAHAAGLEVMLKPHLWLRHGEYTGTYLPSDTLELAQWEEGYRSYVLHFAELAQSKEVAIYCIGTELCAHVQARPEYWAQLIRDVRGVYNGKLTYASNWDCYSSFTHWTELDYIGIDAYFPLVSEQHQDPAIGWTRWKNEMKAFSEETSRPILFTEYGYRSVPFALETPWEMGRDGEVDLETQSLAYQSLYEQVWPEPWFAGGFLWKWHIQENLTGRDRSTRYSPQGKPAAELILKQYDGQSLMKVAE